MKLQHLLSSSCIHRKTFLFLFKWSITVKNIDDGKNALSMVVTAGYKTANVTPALGPDYYAMI